MAAPIDFSVLGDVRARQDGHDLDPGTPQQQAVLGLLLLREGKLLLTEELIDQIWGSNPPQTALCTARTYICRLRRLFTGVGQGHSAILSTSGGYCLPTDSHTLDLTVFQRCVQEARNARAAGDLARAATHLRTALSLWRGAPLAGARGQYVQLERTRLEQIHSNILEERIVLDLELGRHNELIGELICLVNTYPLRERPYQLLMLALYRAGRQADALEVYREIRDLLNNELGIDPGPDLRNLQQQILRSAPQLSSFTTKRQNLLAPYTAVPHPISPFTQSPPQLASA